MTPISFRIDFLQEKANGETQTLGTVPTVSVTPIGCMGAAQQLNFEISFFGYSTGEDRPFARVWMDCFEPVVVQLLGVQQRALRHVEDCLLQYDQHETYALIVPSGVSTRSTYCPCKAYASTVCAY